MIEASAPSSSFNAGLGLALPPFAPDADDAFFFPSDQHLRALEFMGRSLWTRARLAVLTAEHGHGKSLLIRRLLRDLDDRIIVAAVQREPSGPRDFLLQILQQFGFPLEESDKTDRRKLLERFLAHQSATGRLCLLIVENPQGMSPAVLEELRCIARIADADGKRVLKLLLIGQPSLNLVLDSPRMTELGAAQALRFSLGALSEDQTAAYVAHRLRAAGAPNPDILMPAALMPQIHACTRGAPAAINKLCDAALSAAGEAGDLLVTVAALDDAIERLGWSGRRLQTPLEPPAHDAAVTPPKLVVSMQGLPDREFTLAADRLVIGRGAEADIRIDSVFVSRFHALLVHDGKQHLMLDLGSTNGLIVNSRRAMRQALRHRDLIQVGPARVVYLNEHASLSAQPDTGETICFARPAFPQAAGEEQGGAVLGFGRTQASASK